jgi:hypothetical protein
MCSEGWETGERERFEKKNKTGTCYPQGDIKSNAPFHWCILIYAQK